jgi:hypothetical protein
MDDLTADDLSKMADDQVSRFLLQNPSAKQEDALKIRENFTRSYESRSQIGDIVVIRPDGWQWGREECLPNFIVVKVPDMTIEEAKKYEEPLNEMVTEKAPDGKDMQVARLIKFRKHIMDKVVVDNVKLTASSAVQFNKSTVLTKITEKVRE